MSKKQPKALNPEERLQASVARDIQIRQMEEAAKHQANAVSAAKWEVALVQKDEMAKKKRLDEQSQMDLKLSKISSRQIRMARLEELYKMDELKYEEELNMRGLAYRRDRS